MNVTTLLDRLLHHVVVVTDGDSYCMRQAKTHRRRRSTKTS